MDRRYHVPSPSADWRAGRIQRETMDREEAYVRALLAICAREVIDVVFPTWEPVQYVLAKSRERFAAQGVLVLVPAYDVFLRQMDKLEVVRIAEAIGFPCPRTALGGDGDGLAALEREVGYPLVVKPRSASGSRGVALVHDRAALLRHVRAAGVPPDWLLVQEYVPGSQSGRFASYWVVLDRDSRLVVAAGHLRVRSVFRDLAAQGAVWAALDDPALAWAGARLCAALGLTGVALVQAKRDPRDDQWKLIEVNPRIGDTFWIPHAQGLDTPRLALAIARGEPLGPVTVRPDARLFVSPVADLFAFAASLVEWLAHRLAGWQPDDPEDAPPPLPALLRAFRETYRAPGRVIDPFASEFFRDPLVSLAWWGAYAVATLEHQRARWRARRRRPAPAALPVAP